MYIKPRFFFIGVFTLLALICTPITSAAGDSHGNGPIPAATALPDSGEIKPAAADRCPVCGMYPAKRPKSAAAMALKDGRTFYFCGNGCLLRTRQHAKGVIKAPSSDITRMRVRNYFTGASIDARKAWWVAGSDVVGPMGPAIVAFSDMTEVNAFKKRHGGKTVFQLHNMTDALFRQIMPGKKHRKHK